MKSYPDTEWVTSTAVLRLEPDLKTTSVFGGNKFFMGVDSRGGFTYSWAEALIPQKTKLFKEFTSDDVIDKIKDVASQD